LKIRIIKCPFCNHEFFTNDFLLGESSNYYACGNCQLCFPINQNQTIIKSKDLVIWIQNDKIITWSPVRTPALGWNTLTLLEALTDSTKTLLSMKNLKKTQKQLNKILKILRNKIEFAKKNYRPLIQRCDFRETKRTRCNKTPVIGSKNGLNLCSYHYNKITEQKSREITKYLEELN
jgi:hypothetical protein